MRILAADDDAVTRLLVQKVSERLGHQIEVVEDGDSALEGVRANKPDILILDWMMPRMSGIDTAKAVLDIYGDEAPYILMCTARSRPEDLDAALEAGADDYLPKPFGPAELKTRLAIAAARIVRDQESLENRARAHRADHLEALSTLAQGVAHDFSNTFGPILAYSQMLRSAFEEGDTNHRRLESILRSCERGMKLVKQISNYTAIERTPKERVKAEEIMSGFNEFCDQHNVERPKQLETDSLEHPCQCAPYLLGEALFNLYTNALRATANDQTRVWVTCKLSDRDPRRRLM
ncbi:MAG: response regulator, partial [Planctomycetes bacterium]|nr:response regulator [Planctomycetota bacterium]